MIVDRHLVDNGAGWRLSLSRRRESTPPVGRPVLIIPGYGMNSYIFGFHPNGPSMIECFAMRGLEVWTVDLRGQGRSIRARGSQRKQRCRDQNTHENSLPAFARRLSFIVCSAK